MTTDIAAHIAEVRARIARLKYEGPLYTELANVALPQTLDLLEAEHARAERLAEALINIRGSVDTTQDAWEIATAALEAQEHPNERP